MVTDFKANNDLRWFRECDGRTNEGRKREMHSSRSIWLGMDGDLIVRMGIVLDYTGTASN